MNKKFSVSRLVTVLLCTLAIGLAAASCGTSKTSTYRNSSYSKQRTRHQPRWNATTSQTTTYYIRKHSTRKRR